MRTLVAMLVAAAAAAACSPYSPTLTDEPFLCGSGSGSNECPDNYSCVTMGTDKVCVKTSGSDMPDAGGSGSCNNDSALNNNSFQTAFVTPVDGNGSHDSVMYTDLGICSNGDQQFYQLTVSPLMETFCAVVTYPAQGSALQANLLNSSDITNTAFVAGSAADTLQGYVANLSSGTWVIEVGAAGPGSGSGTNNYTLEIQVSTTGSTPACTVP
jgi:hypothetical protein